MTSPLRGTTPTGSPRSTAPRRCGPGPSGERAARRTLVARSAKRRSTGIVSITSTGQTRATASCCWRQPTRARPTRSGTPSSPRKSPSAGSVRGAVAGADPALPGSRQGLDDPRRAGPPHDSSAHGDHANAAAEVLEATLSAEDAGLQDPVYRGPNADPTRLAELSGGRVRADCASRSIARTAVRHRVPRAAATGISGSSVRAPPGEDGVNLSLRAEVDLDPAARSRGCGVEQSTERPGVVGGCLTIREPARPRDRGVCVTARRNDPAHLVRARCSCPSVRRHRRQAAGVDPSLRSIGVSGPRPPVLDLQARPAPPVAHRAPRAPKPTPPVEGGFVRVRLFGSRGDTEHTAEPVLGGGSEIGPRPAPEAPAVPRGRCSTDKSPLPPRPPVGLPRQRLRRR